MLQLERKGSEVYNNGNKLTINKQATKGLGKEVVKIEGIEGSNGQKWFSLSKLKEGMNEVECQGREVTHSKKYVLTPQEQTKVDKHQSAIDTIVEEAKSRYVPMPKLNINPNKLEGKAKEEYIANLQKALDNLLAQK